jgi:hypothetical protein
MAMPMRSADYQNEPAPTDDPRSSEVRRVWSGQSPNAVQFALRDAQNMLALLAANVEFLVKPDEPSADAVAGDIRDSTRRLGQLLNVVAALLEQSE